MFVYSPVMLYQLIVFKILYGYAVPFFKINHILTECERIKSVPVGKLFGRCAIPLFNSCWSFEVKTCFNKQSHVLSSWVRTKFRREHRASRIVWIWNACLWGYALPSTSRAVSSSIPNYLTTKHRDAKKHINSKLINWQHVHSCEHFWACYSHQSKTLWIFRTAESIRLKPELEVSNVSEQQ